MTEETGAVESPQPEVTDVADVSTDDLRAMMESEPVEAPEQGEIDQPETSSDVETEEERLAKRRIRPKSALDQQVLDLYKSEAFEGSFADASRVIYQQETPPTNLSQQPQVADNRPDPLAKYDERVSQLQTEITDLEGKVEEAADNLETAEALKLQRDITRRELEVQNLLTTKNGELQRRQEAQYNTHRVKAEESRDKALAEYPELQDENSLPRKQFDEYIRQAQQDPDYASVFKSPLWPEFMVREFVATVNSNAAAAQKGAPQQQAPVIGNQAKVLTTGTTAQPATAPITPEQVVSNMSQMSNDQLYALLGTDDGRRPPLR